MALRSRVLMQLQEFVVRILGNFLAIGHNSLVSEKFEYVSIGICGQRVRLLIAVEGEPAPPSSSEHQYQHPRRWPEEWHTQ